MKSTIRTEAGTITLEATPAGVLMNGQRMPAHEAALLGYELTRAAGASAQRSAGYIAQVIAGQRQGDKL